MDSVYHFISQYFFVYIWLIITTFIDMIAPISGSTVVNPVTAFFTDPQRAIGISSLLFFFTGVYRVYLFRKELLSDKVNLKVFSSMLPFTIAGAICGGLFISYLNIKILVLMIISVSIYYIFKNLYQLIKNKKTELKITGLSFIFIATISGFFQASGMPGGDIKRNYLRTVLSEISVRAVSSALGMINLFIGGTIIFLRNKLTHGDLILIITVLPFLLLALKYGKTFLEKIPDRHAKILASSLSFLGIVLLIYKYFL